MDLSEIEQKVEKVIRNVLLIKDKKIEKESTIADLGGDSLSALGILSALEQEFDIDIPDEEAQKIESFATAVEVVMNRSASEG